MKNQLASEWAEHGVRVNNVNPGYIATDMVAEVLEADATMANEWRRRMLQEEIAPPETLGPIVVFLASDASAYMTGESVTVDGGYTVR